MKILSDICVHKDLVHALRETGLELVRAVDKGFARAPDDDIYDYAQKHDYIILSFDKDFGNTARFDIKHSCGVVLVYVEDMAREEIIWKTKEFFKHTNTKELKRKLHIIESGGIRHWPRP